MIEDNALVLFQGDSITDANRDRGNAAGMGDGYAMMTAAWFSASHPGKKVSFLNRGVSGDRAKDLVARWRPDCLDLKPAWVSIMIGINDCWRRYDGNDPTSPGDFERNYRLVLEQAVQSGAKLVLLEPFVLPVPEDRKRWREDLDPKILVVRGLAKEFAATLVPLDRLFAEAARSRPPEFWAADGVHPSPAGHALISQAWLRAVKAL
jgi:lysophospholipase L1-like esterase